MHRTDQEVLGTTRQEDPVMRFTNGWHTALRHIVALCFAVLIGTTAAAAQDPDDREEEAVAPDTAEATIRATPRATPQLWNVELRLGGTLDTNADRNADDELTAPGLSAGVMIGVQNRARRPTLLADYRGMVHTFAGTERWDRTTHRARVTHNLDLGGPWSLETTATGSTGLITLEYRQTDQVSLVPQLQYQPSRAHRWRAHAAYRQRWYRDATRSSAFSPYAGADYRHRLGSWHFVDVNYRFEYNRAELDSRDYTRSSYTTSYTRPLSSSNRIRLRLAYQDVDYRHRTVSGGAVGETRRDDRWIPSVFFVQEITDALRLDLEYQVRTRRSNDAIRDYDAHRFSATARYQW